MNLSAWRWPRRFLSVALFVLVPVSAWAGPAVPPALQGRPDVAVPDPLKPWVGWALHGDASALCPFRDGEKDERDCAWPARLQLQLDEHGGSFTQRWRVYVRLGVPLPGDKKRWPEEVRVDGQPAVVTPDAGTGGPVLLLAPGDHTVTGRFAWDSLPESIQVPKETGLVALTVKGEGVSLPSRDAAGQLWLHRAESPKEADVLEMTVHRKVVDEIPLTLTTRLELRVSGRSREVLTGRALPAGFVPMALDSPLPARLESDGRLRMQVRPGGWVIQLVARHEGTKGPVEALSRPEPEGPWDEDDEVWVVETHPELRQVTVEGVAAIDPQQTTLPEEWKRLPAYPMKGGDVLHLREQRRGDAEPAPDQLELTRQLWLDFDGAGYTVSDRITGKLRRAWRLEMNPPTELGRVAVGGQDQFITRSPGKEGGPAGATPGGTSGASAGVEVRQGQVEISADSRILGAPWAIPAVGWDMDFQKVAGTLHLPPGWWLLHASGVDDVPGTWIGRWTLLDLFLLLIIAMAVGRLWGVRWGLVALGTLALALPEEEGPRWVWLAVLGVEALMRVLPEGRLRRYLGWLRLGTRVVLVLVLVGFVTGEVRRGIYPALEQGADEGNSGSWVIGGAAAPRSAEAPTMQVAAAPEPEPEMEQAKASPAKPAEEKALDDSIEGEDEETRSQVNAPAGRGEAASGGGLGIVSLAKSNASGKKVKRKVPAQYLQEYDPHAVIQTGPGLPGWSWRELALRWSGPVERQQVLRLYLVSPRVNLVLVLVRVLLCMLLGLRLLGLPGEHLPRWLRPWLGPLPGAALLGLLLVGGPARAEVPPRELLDQLRARLTEQPLCMPHCAASPRLLLEVTPERLRLRMEVDAAAATAVPLPGSASQWLPAEVLLDGQPASGLERTDDGRLWLALSPGKHQVLLEGPLPGRDTVQIALPLHPHHVTAQASGWRLDGLHEDGLADDDLQLTRVETGAGGPRAALQPGVLPSFVRVERSLHLGLRWEADTRVVRLTPPGAAVVLEVPLLPGESVTTPEVRVVGGKALVNMGPGATEIGWHSLLQEQPEVQLAAPRNVAWVEEWRLDVSPVWHVGLKGIPVVHPSDAGAGTGAAGEGDAHLPVWRPWPGETVTVAVARPAGVAGQTLTIDASRMEVVPGLRATDVTLKLTMRTSRGAEHVIVLPEGAVLQSLSLGGKTQPVRQEGRKVRLLLYPGRQQAELAWREPRGIEPRFKAAAVDLGAPSVNAEVVIRPGADRWILFVGGPRLGPAVLFWSLVLVLVLVTFLLGRVRLTPLGTREWLFLGLGLSQVPLVAAAAVAGWLLALGWRHEHPQQPGWMRFNLRQFALAVWTLVALGILVAAIQEGLLGEPDMQIAGPGSTRYELRWFQDRIPAGAVLPEPWVLSVPVLAYRLAMLAWALWMARALLAWLRWGWTAFSRGGWWKRKPRPVLIPSAVPGVGVPRAGEQGMGEAPVAVTPGAPAEEAQAGAAVAVAPTEGEGREGGG